MLNNSVSAAMMEKSLSALWQRQQLVLTNIANEDTPGYKAKRLEFESLLKREMGARTNVTAFDKSRAMTRLDSLQPVVYDDKDTVGRADGNNVDIDAEHVQLAKTQIQYDAMVRKLSGHYSSLKYAITGGR